MVKSVENSIFTAQCCAERDIASMSSVRPSICLSVCNVGGL